MDREEILERLNDNARECIIKNRRKGPDFLLQIVNMIGLIIWFFFLALLSICDKAGVELFDFHQKVDDINDVGWLNVAIIMATLMFVISAVLLLLSLKRTRRRTDKIKISLLVSEIISFFIGILLLFKLY